MNNSAIETEFNAEDVAVNIIKNAIDCRVHSVGRTFNDHQYSSGWITRPLTSFTQLLDGRSSIAFDRDPTTAIIR